MRKFILFGALNLLTALACAQLIPLEEKDMGEVTAGVGLALNDVMFIGAPNASIQLTFDTDTGADGGFVDHIAIHGGRNAFSNETSYNTCLESPSIVNCEGATVGDLSNLSTSFPYHLYPRHLFCEHCVQLARHNPYQLKHGQHDAALTQQQGQPRGYICP